MISLHLIAFWPSDFIKNIESKVEQYQLLSSLIPFDPDAKNEKKKTAIQIAMEKGNSSFVQVLFCIKPEVIDYNSDVLLVYSILSS